MSEEHREQTGEAEEVIVPEGGYLLICVRPAHLTHTQAHGNGTHVLTIKETGASVLSPPTRTGETS